MHNVLVAITNIYEWNVGILFMACKEGNVCLLEFIHMTTKILPLAPCILHTEIKFSSTFDNVPYCFFKVAIIV